MARMALVIAVFTAAIVARPAAGEAAVAAKERVWVIGDSVLLGAQDAIRSRLAPQYDVVVEGWVALFLTKAIGLMRERRHLIDQVAVIHLGNNYYGNQAQFSGEIDEAMRVLEGVDRVIWLTVREFEPSRRQVNDALRAAATRWPNMTVADWNPIVSADRSLTWSDGLHLRPVGADAMAALIARQLDEWQASRRPPPGSWWAMPPRFRGGVFVTAARIDASSTDVVVAGADAGGGPQVSLFDATGRPRGGFFAYADGFRGGVRVAACDLTADGLDEIVTAPGPGGGPDIRVFDGRGRLLRSFLAYDAGWAGGVYVACGDVDGDGKGEIITGAGPGGGPDVRVFHGDRGGRRAAFFAYASTFTGGVRVATADVDGDGRAEVVTGAGPGGGPHVRVFGEDGAPRAGFFPYPASFTGGVYVAGGDVTASPADDIVTGAGEGGGSHIRVVDGAGRDRAPAQLAWANGMTGARVAVGRFSGGAVVAGAGRGSGPFARIVGY
jgi:hypothetical protein